VRRFCVDIDNVVASTDAVMRQVIEDFTDGRVRLSYDDVVRFNYFECRDSSGRGITRDEWRAVHDLFSEPRYLWLCQPRDGAVEALRELAEYGRIHIATSRLPKARRVTFEWLESHRVPLHALHFVGHGEKHLALRSYAAAVEDDYEQAVAFATEAETPCLVMSHPWNRNGQAVTGLEWVQSWREVVTRLTAR
jgi:uncharacterized HAD superfamily protein